MNKPRHPARLDALSSAIIAALSLMLAYAIRFGLMDGTPSYPARYYLAVALLFGAVQGAVRLLSLSLLGAPQGLLPRVRRTLAGASLTLLCTFALLFLLRLLDLSRLALLMGWALNALLLSAKDVLAMRLRANAYASGRFTRRVLLIGEGKTAQRYAAAVLARPQCGRELAGYVSLKGAIPGAAFLGDYEHIARALACAGADEAVIALPAEEYARLDALIDACERHGLPPQIIPCYEERISSRISASVFEGMHMIGIRHIPLRQRHNAALKRACDVVIAVLMLTLLAPLMLAIAAGVRLSTHDTALFTQVRVGQDKKPFLMYKFRSMVRNDEEDSAWTTRSDARRTRFGAIIRKLSLDELPQLINVLRGEMSIVGPRPELPHFVEQFAGEIPLYMLRHSVRPGITGLAQVNGLRGDTSIRRRIEYDIEYIENWSLWLDAKILLRTIPSLVNDETLFLRKS